MILSIAVAAVLAVAALADKPMDRPCVTWEPLTSNNVTDPSDLFIAAYTWVVQVHGQCYAKGDIIPCFASDSGVNTWGHHNYQPEDTPSDYCRTYYQGEVYLSNNMYVPKKGPQWQTWKWVLSQSGGVVPANAIRYGESVLVRSTHNAPGFCSGKGFTGWARTTDGTFGPVYFSITTNPVISDTFDVAVCDPVNTTTPAPTSQPKLPHHNKPYVRFAHAVPSTNNVFATITQGSTSYTWNNYHFGAFSGWVDIFATGTGTIDVYESNSNGAKGSLLVSTVIPLTPGPLVVAIKDFWPPNTPTSVQTIVAAFGTSARPGVRLFNLSPDTPSAGMKVNGAVMAGGIPYTFGSRWAPIPADVSTFEVFNNATGTQLCVDTFSPSEAPFTNFLIGLGNETSGSILVTRVVPLIDDVPMQ